uniref:Uncharacterized protein n=1 Tax=Anguilla anguilla TaxID=7936 RepID=A0A0E9W9V8_ANGAN
MYVVYFRTEMYYFKQIIHFLVQCHVQYTMKNIQLNVCFVKTILQMCKNVQ